MTTSGIFFASPYTTYLLFSAEPSIIFYSKPPVRRASRIVPRRSTSFLFKRLPVSSSFFFFTLLCLFLLHTRIQWSYTLHQSRLNISRTCNTNFSPPFPCFLLFPPSFFLRSLVPLTHITGNTELKPKILAESFRFHCIVNFLGYRCYSRLSKVIRPIYLAVQRSCFPFAVKAVVCTLSDFFQITYLWFMRLLVVDFNCVSRWHHVL